MKEIIFRGKRKDNDEWTFGYYYANGNTHYIKVPKINTDNITYYGNLNDDYEVISETVGEYTGLTDKHKNKIFDGDILLHIEFCHDSVQENYDYVYFSNGCFKVDMYSGDVLADISDLGNYKDNNLADYMDYQVIGNIHDNPKLMKGKMKHNDKSNAND